MAESEGKREAGGALPHRWGGWVDACWEAGGGGLLCTPHPPSSSPLAPKGTCKEGGRKAHKGQGGQCEMSSLLLPSPFFISALKCWVPDGSTSKRPSHSVPRGGNTWHQDVPWMILFLFFKKVNVGVGWGGPWERKENLRFQPVHDAVLTAGFRMFYCLLLMLAFFLFFSLQWECTFFIIMMRKQVVF